MFTGKSQGNTLQHDKFISWLTGVGVLIEMGKYQFSKVTVCPNASHAWGTRKKSTFGRVYHCPLSLITYSHQFLIRAIERCLMCKQSSDKIKPKGYRYRKRTKFKIYIYCVYMYKSLVACICLIFVSIHLFFIKNSSLDNCYIGANLSPVINHFTFKVHFWFHPSICM